MLLLFRLARRPRVRIGQCLEWLPTAKISNKRDEEAWIAESVKRASTVLTLEELDPSLHEPPPNQAPNRATTWSQRQRSRKDVLQGPRYTGIDLTAQPQPLAAIELLKQQPITIVSDRKTTCDGGGVLGHPTIFINLDDTSQAHSCGYCGKRFQQTKENGHH